MSIIDYTQRLKLTQYTGNSIMPQFMRNYNSDMAKIDAYFDEYEAGINQTISEMQTDIDNFETQIEGEMQVLSTEVGTYSGRITTLEDCCTAVNATLSNYGSRLNAIELVIETVSTQNIEDLIARIDALEIKVNANSTEIVTLQHDLGEAVERIGDAEATIVLHAAEITALANRVTVLEDCCVEVRATLVAYDARITQNTTDIRALEDRLTRDETNIAGNAQDIIINSQQIAVNTQDIQDLKDAFDTLDPQSALSVVRQVAINTENISNLQSSVSAQSTSISNLTSRIAGDEETIASNITRIVTLEEEFAEIENWQSEIDAATAAATQASADAAQASADVAAMQSDITSIESDITALEAADTALGTRVTTLETKVASDESAFTALEARVTANEGSITNIESTIHDDEAGLANVTSRVSALETQNGSVDISAVGNSVTDAVDKVNTKVVNAASMATQALATANSVATTVGDSNAGLVKDVADNASDISAIETTIGDNSSGMIKDIADNASDISDIQALIPNGASTSNMLLAKSGIFDGYSILHTYANYTASTGTACRTIHYNIALNIRTKLLELKNAGYDFAFIMNAVGPNGEIALAKPIDLNSFTSSTNLILTGDKGGTYSTNGTATQNATYHYCMTFRTDNPNNCGCTAYTVISTGITGFAEYSDTNYTGSWNSWIIGLKKTLT